MNYVVYVCAGLDCSSLTLHLLFRGKPVLLPTILELLREEIGVDARVDKNNVGRIRVSGASVHEFIESKRWKE